VRATDTAGNVDPTPASRIWTVDTTATRILTSVTDTKISENAPTTKYAARKGADGNEPTESGNDIYALIE
jgi:hypothetical protein